MNTYERKTVVQISEQLHICLVKAIDTALSERFGEGWFSGFCEFDYAQDIPILDKSHTSVSRMDFQACLKFLRYREEYAKIVFEYYGYNFYFDTDDAKKAQRLLNQRLENLIHNVRNYLFAHASATMVEAGRDDSMRYSVYGADEAVSDMLKLASFFSEVTDDEGNSYYLKMQDLSRPSVRYSALDAIKSEKLKIDIGTFVVACNQLDIPIATEPGGDIKFYTSNYEGDIARIKLKLYSEDKKGHNKKRMIVGALSVLAALLVMVVVIAVAFGGPFRSGEEIPSADDEKTLYSTSVESQKVNQGNIYGANSQYDPVILTVDGYRWLDDGLEIYAKLKNAGASEYHVDSIYLGIKKRDTYETIASRIFYPDNFSLDTGEIKQYIFKFSGQDIRSKENLNDGVEYEPHFNRKSG